MVQSVRHLLSLGFVEAKTDTSLFIFRRGTDMIYLLLYVGDIVLTASSRHSSVAPFRRYSWSSP